MKKLIPALCLLLITAALMGTSTFAWFAMNTSVDATGMEVIAVTEESLLIKGDSETNFTSIGSEDVDNDELKPCTSADGKTFGVLSSSVKVKSAASSAATWSGTSGAFAASDLTSTTSSTYVATATYQVKNVGADCSLYVSSLTFTAGTGSKDVKKAARCSVTMGDTTLIFNIGGGDLTDGKAGLYSSSAWSLAAPSYTTAGTSAVLGDLSDGVAEDVTVKIWFEGQDENCYTDVIDTVNSTLQITFGSTAAD